MLPFNKKSARQMAYRAMKAERVLQAHHGSLARAAKEELGPGRRFFCPAIGHVIPAGCCEERQRLAHTGLVPVVTESCERCERYKSCG